jgi:hypothetical protein
VLCACGYAAEGDEGVGGGGISLVVVVGMPTVP